MICWGMHSNVILRFMVQAFPDPPLCSSTKMSTFKKLGCFSSFFPSKMFAKSQVIFFALDILNIPKWKMHLQNTLYCVNGLCFWTETPAEIAFMDVTTISCEKSKAFGVIANQAKFMYTSCHWLISVSSMKPLSSYQLIVFVFYVCSLHLFLTGFKMSFEHKFLVNYSYL